MKTKMNLRPKTREHTPTIETAKRVCLLVDHGLSSGIGFPRPGQMCVEAAVCYAMGMPHSDNPTCVNGNVRSYKIGLNDADWSTRKARGEGLKRVAVAQLGSIAITDMNFSRELVKQLCKKLLPLWVKMDPEWRGEAKRKALKEFSKEENPNRLLSALTRIDTWGPSGTLRRAYNLGFNAAPAVFKIANDCVGWTKTGKRKLRDSIYALAAECAVQALKKLKSPGCKWLHLCK